MLKICAKIEITGKVRRSFSVSCHNRRVNCDNLPFSYTFKGQPVDIYIKGSDATENTSLEHFLIKNDLELKTFLDYLKAHQHHAIALVRNSHNSTPQNMCIHLTDDNELQFYPMRNLNDNYSLLPYYNTLDKNTYDLRSTPIQTNIPNSLREIPIRQHLIDEDEKNKILIKHYETETEDTSYHLQGSQLSLEQQRQLYENILTLKDTHWNSNFKSYFESLTINCLKSAIQRSEPTHLEASDKTQRDVLLATFFNHHALTAFCGALSAQTEEVTAEMAMAYYVGLIQQKLIADNQQPVPPEELIETRYHDNTQEIKRLIPSQQEGLTASEATLFTAMVNLLSINPNQHDFFKSYLSQPAYMPLAEDIVNMLTDLKDVASGEKQTTTLVKYTAIYNNLLATYTIEDWGGFLAIINALLNSPALKLLHLENQIKSNQWHNIDKMFPNGCSPTEEELIGIIKQTPAEQQMDTIKWIILSVLNQKWNVHPQDLSNFIFSPLIAKQLLQTISTTEVIDLIKMCGLCLPENGLRLIVQQTPESRQSELMTSMIAYLREAFVNIRKKEIINFFSWDFTIKHLFQSDNYDEIIPQLENILDYKYNNDLLRIFYTNIEPQHRGDFFKAVMVNLKNKTIWMEPEEMLNFITWAPFTGLLSKEDLLSHALSLFLLNSFNPFNIIPSLHNPILIQHTTEILNILIEIKRAASGETLSSPRLECSTTFDLLVNAYPRHPSLTESSVRATGWPYFLNLINALISSEAFCDAYILPQFKVDNWTNNDQTIRRLGGIMTKPLIMHILNNAPKQEKAALIQSIITNIFNRTIQLNNEERMAFFLSPEINSALSQENKLFYALDFFAFARKKPDLFKEKVLLQINKLELFKLLINIRNDISDDKLNTMPLEYQNIYANLCANYSLANKDDFLQVLDALLNYPAFVNWLPPSEYLTLYIIPQFKANQLVNFTPEHRRLNLIKSIITNYNNGKIRLTTEERLALFTSPLAVQLMTPKNHHDIREELINIIKNTPLGSTELLNAHIPLFLIDQLTTPELQTFLGLDNTPLISDNTLLIKVIQSSHATTKLSDEQKIIYFKSILVKLEENDLLRNVIKACWKPYRNNNDREPGQFASRMFCNISPARALYEFTQEPLKQFNINERVHIRLNAITNYISQYPDDEFTKVLQDLFIPSRLKETLGALFEDIKHDIRPVDKPHRPN